MKVALKQHQFDALVSFHFNTGAIGRASFVKLLNAGDLVGAAKGFMDWKKPAEIIGRRRAEQALFRDGVYGADGKVTAYPASASGSVQWSIRMPSPRSPLRKSACLQHRRTSSSEAGGADDHHL